MLHCIVREELLPTIKDNNKFINAIQLSKILSAIRYNQMIYLIVTEKDTNSSIGFHLFLNQAALLFEGIKTFELLKSEFESLESYNKNIEDIEEIFREKEDINSFYNRVLKKARNKIIFHFDKEVIKEIFEGFVNDCISKGKNIMFASGKTELIADINYNLADDMNFNYLLKLTNDNNLPEENKFTNMVKELSNLSKLFCGVLEHLIGELIQDICMKEVK